MRDPITGKPIPRQVGGQYYSETGVPFFDNLTESYTVAASIAKRVIAAPQFHAMMRVVAGGFETISGVVVIVNPFVPGVSQVVGVLLIGHGLDSMIAGLRSAEEGKEVQTLTYQIASGAAKEWGLSDKTADTIGMVADNAPGVLDLVHGGAQGLVSLARRGLSSGRSLGRASESLLREVGSAEKGLAKASKAEVHVLELTESEAKALGAGAPANVLRSEGATSWRALDPKLQRATTEWDAELLALYNQQYGKTATELPRNTPLSWTGQNLENWEVLALSERNTAEHIFIRTADNRYFLVRGEPGSVRPPDLRTLQVPTMPREVVHTHPSNPIASLEDMRYMANHAERGSTFTIVSRGQGNNVVSVAYTFEDAQYLSKWYGNKKWYQRMGEILRRHNVPIPDEYRALFGFYGVIQIP